MEHIRGQKISMIFQDPMTALNPVLTVGDQIGEALYLHNEEGLSQKEIDKKTEETLELVWSSRLRLCAIRGFLLQMNRPQLLM